MNSEDLFSLLGPQSLYCGTHSCAGEENLLLKLAREDVSKSIFERASSATLRKRNLYEFFVERNGNIIL